MNELTQPIFTLTSNPLLPIILLRGLLLYVLGLVLVIGLNKFTLRGLWQSNVGQRYLSWLVIGPLYMVIVFLGGYYSLAFLFVIMLLALHEVRSASSLPLSYHLGLIALSAISIVVAVFFPQYFYSLPLIYFMVITYLAIRQNSAKQSFINASICMFVSIWIIFSLTHFILLGQLDAQLGANRALLLMLGFAIPLSDIFAYIVGKSFSKIKLLDQYKVASNISPKKSYIGSLGNMLGIGIGILLVYFSVREYAVLQNWIILAIVLGLGGLSGDLIASMFKRYYNLKDSSQLIPGHGGILDRIDSSLRIVVITYYFLLFVT